jgi:methanogenic corrinoid protein MtbC1
MPETLDAGGLNAFKALERSAVAEVTQRLYESFATGAYSAGDAGYLQCADDVAYQLEFLRPVLEFGTVQPLVNYLRWQESCIPQSSLAASHVSESLQYAADFFAGELAAPFGASVKAVFSAVTDAFLSPAEFSAEAPHAPAAWPQSADFLAALLAGNHTAAIAELDRAMDGGAGLIDFEMHVIQPALYQIGELWQSNQVSVAQEHLASAIVHTVMTLGLLRSPQENLNGKKVLLACVEGNHHAVGLRMVADSFMLSGWDVQYLGANVPTESLVEQVTQWRPELLGLSVSFASQIPVAKAVIQTLKNRLGEQSPAVMIGGLAINRCEPMAVVAGADAHFADAQTAQMHIDDVLQASAQTRLGGEV